MRITKLGTILAIIGSIILLKSCTNDLESNDSQNKVDTYDKSAMVQNYTEGYIIPAYTTYVAQLLHLKTKVVEFRNTSATINELRTSWNDALLLWQDVAFLEFGPAAKYSLRAQTNLYPVDVTLVNANIEHGSFDLEPSSKWDAKGLQAIDFLLFGVKETDAEIITYYNNTPNAHIYLEAVVDELHTTTNQVLQEWIQSYGTEFNANTANNAQGSAVHEMVNAINAHYETYIRKGKIGLPAGVFNGISELPMPTHVEAYYQGESIIFAHRAVSSLQQFLNGESYNQMSKGNGFIEYLSYVEAQNNGDDLNVLILEQLSSILTALDQIKGSLQDEVLHNKEGVRTVYDQMQQLVPYLKIDMVNALETTITYQDNDGD